MTRASLLHVLDHLSEISDADVREVEQLATTFPYCQTAHLLLAKAAHDRGSMLASQRLRRAATYATDRQLLRQLIEFTAPAPALLASPVVEQQAAATAIVLPDAPAVEPAATSVETEQEAPITDSESLTEVDFSDAEPTPTIDSVAASTPEEPETEEVSVPTPAQLTAPEAEVLASEITEEQTNASVTEEREEAGSAVSSAEGSADSAFETVTPPLDDVREEATIEREQTEAEQLATTTAKEEPVPLVEEPLPAVAPPIRPPLETGSSQFEFGLSDSLPASPVYELLGAEAAEPESTITSVSATPPAFYGVADVGYGYGGGSRLGYCLQSPDELTATLPLGSVEPDALILEHLAAQQATASTRTSVDIISQFLRNKPRMKAPTVLSRMANEQADLSVSSTRTEPDLASESLALILVRQGKKDRAIEIYERLMVRQPEKMAYFADQIQKLKISE